MRRPYLLEIVPEPDGWRVRQPGHTSSFIFADLGTAIDAATAPAETGTLVRIVVRRCVQERFGAAEAAAA